MSIFAKLSGVFFNGGGVHKINDLLNGIKHNDQEGGFIWKIENNVEFEEMLKKLYDENDKKISDNIPKSNDDILIKTYYNMLRLTFEYLLYYMYYHLLLKLYESQDTNIDEMKNILKSFLTQSMGNIDYIINDILISFFNTNGIFFTMNRPYKINDEMKELSNDDVDKINSLFSDDKIYLLLYTYYIILHHIFSDTSKLDYKTYNDSDIDAYISENIGKIKLKEIGESHECSVDDVGCIENQLRERRSYIATLKKHEMEQTQRSKSMPLPSKMTDSDVVEPKVVKLEAAKPDTDLGVVEPEVVKPDTAKPDTDSDVAEPEVVEPEVVKLEAAKLDAAKPDAKSDADSDVAEPERKISLQSMYSHDSLDDDGEPKSARTVKSEEIDTTLKPELNADLDYIDEGVSSDTVRRIMGMAMQDEEDEDDKKMRESAGNNQLKKSGFIKNTKYIGGGVTEKSDINDIIKNKQNILDKIITLNWDINNLKSNNNDIDLINNFKLKHELLSNIGDNINEMSELIKTGGSCEISDKLNENMYKYQNIVDKIKTSNNNSNINIKQNENDVKELLMNLHKKISNEYNEILNDNDKEYKQSKMNDLVDKLNEIYENENVIIQVMIQTKNNDNSNIKMTEKIKELKLYEKQNEILNDIINSRYDKIVQEYIHKPDIKTKVEDKYKYNEIINSEQNMSDDIYFDIYSNEVNNNNEKINENNINEIKITNNKIKSNIEYINDKKYFNMLGKIKKYNDNKFFIISPKDFNYKMKILNENDLECQEKMLDINNKLDIENMNYVLNIIKNINENKEKKSNNGEVYKLITKLDEIPEIKLNEIIDHYNKITSKIKFNDDIKESNQKKRTRSRSRKRKNK